MSVVAPVEGPLKRRLLPAGSAWARPLAIVGIVIAGIWIVIAIAAPLLAPDGPLAQNVPGANKGPSWHHLFGTDELGRDVLSRVMYGSRHSLPVAILLVALAVLALLFARAERRDFHLPGGDGTVVMLAGAWAALLLVWRLFDKPGITTRGVAANVGVQWGIFFALAAAGFLTYAGS
ncbi:MAG: hypothetical protein QOJ47_1941, partial [Gaiellales bacterium]|nr:hypothetical protein [Gaiellales bacterium]